MFTAGNSVDETIPAAPPKTPRDRAIDQLQAMFFTTTGRKLSLTEVAEFVDYIIEAAEGRVKEHFQRGQQLAEGKTTAKTKGEQP